MVIEIYDIEELFMIPFESAHKMIFNTKKARLSQ